MSYKLNYDEFSKYLGFVAQDVETVIPDAVDGKKYEYDFLRDASGRYILDASGKPIEDPDKKEPRYRGLSYNAITTTVVKAMQEQNVIITNQQQTIEQQQQTIQTLQEQLQSLQTLVNQLITANSLKTS